MRENQIQPAFIRRLEREFPGCIVLKNDTGYLQGVPDLSVFFQDKWAMFEVKADRFASKRPNQSYWVERFNAMSFAAFVYPENEGAVLDALQHTFGSTRPTRISQPE